MGRFYPIPLTVPFVNDARSLGFLAHSVIIDNFTNQWLYEGNSGFFIEPYHGKVVLNMNGGQQSDIRLQAPSGFPQASPITGQSLLVVYQEDEAIFNAGENVQDLSSGTAPTAPSVLAVLNTLVNASQGFSGGGSFVNSSVAIAASGARLKLSGTLNKPVVCSVTGDQTGSVYFSGLLTPPATPIITISAEDTTVTCKASGGLGTSFRVDELLFAELESQQKGVSPAAWQAPTTGVVVNATGLATTTLIAAVAGQGVYIFGVIVAVEVAGATSRIAIEDTTGLGLFSVEGNAVGNIPFNGYGLRTAIGSGLRVTISNVTATIRVSVAYTQAA